MVGGEDDAVRTRASGAGTDGGQDHSLRRRPAAGQAAKLCNNMVLAVQQIAVGEAFVLAEKLGLSAQSLFDVITGATGNCWAVHTNCPVPGPVPTSPANNDFKPGFATALMNKDLGLAMDAVELDRLGGAAGQPRRRDLREVRRRPRRQGLQRGHRDAARRLGPASPAPSVEPLVVHHRWCSRVHPRRQEPGVTRSHLSGPGVVVVGGVSGGDTTVASLAATAARRPRAAADHGQRALRRQTQFPQRVSVQVGLAPGCAVRSSSVTTVSTMPSPISCRTSGSTQRRGPLPTTATRHPATNRPITRSRGPAAASGRRRAPTPRTTRSWSGRRARRSRR